MMLLYDMGRHSYGDNSVFIIKMITIFICLFNIIFIVLWMLYKLPLYLRIENKKLDKVIKIDGGNIIKILCFEQNADDAIDISWY